ncbi:MAG: cytochrome c oxidase subunit II [Dehalococcoidia bacterium]
MRGYRGVFRHLRRSAVLLLPALLFLFVSGCTGDPQDTLTRDGAISDRITDLFLLVIAIAAVVFVGVEGALIYIVVRYRRRPNQEGLPAQVHGSTPLELTWTIVPAVILALLAIPTISGIRFLSDTPDNALEVTVTAQQWWWGFEYPDQGVVTADEMYIPVNTPVHVTLQSNDIIHSFWVPRLAGKTDVVPSNNPKQALNTMWFNAKEPGTYTGQCAEFCGLSHAKMKFSVVAVTQDEFDQWLREQQAPAATPTGAALQGQQLFNSLPCIACHTIDGTVAQGTVGPNLTHFASREKFAGGWLENNTENLTDWLADPPAIKPGSLMPNYNLTPDQINLLIAYLQSLE